MSGIWLALGAYTIWGFFPIYMHWLIKVPALEIVSHRVIWSFALVAISLVVIGRFGLLVRTLYSRTIAIYAGAAALISVNWGTFIVGVNSGRTLEASLGYFLSPVVSVVLGAVVLKEKLSRLQYVGVLIATLGVLYISMASATFPWIALTLAATFGMYGLVKKKAPLPALDGLALETLILSPAAVLILFWLAARGDLIFMHTDRITDMLLVLSGVLTLVPLALFAAAATRTALATLGMLQYTAPTLQFLVGFFAFGEPLGTRRLAGFTLVWAGLIVYACSTRGKGSPRRHINTSQTRS